MDLTTGPAYSDGAAAGSREREEIVAQETVWHRYARRLPPVQHGRRLTQSGESLPGERQPGQLCEIMSSSARVVRLLSITISFEVKNNP